MLPLLLLLAVVAAMAQLAGVSGSGDRSGTRIIFEGTHESWLVKAPQASTASVRSATSKLGGGKTGTPLADGWYEVTLGESVTAAEAEAVFGAAGAVEVEPVLARLPYGEPVGIDDSAGGTAGVSELRAGPVNAPRIAEQWALAQDNDQDIDAPEAWGAHTGAGAVVAVIDTGVEAAHPDLVGRVLPGRDFSGAATPATVDKVGHGTSVASVIAANGTSIAGIAPGAKILPLKVFRDSAGGFSMAGYLAAIRYAADQGVDVINISLGCGGSTACFSQAELDALTYATERGVLITAAAGNGDRSGNGINNDAPATPDYPSGYELPGILSVTSSTRLGSWATWANYGATSVDLAAPGEGLLVAAQYGSYRMESGTSFSAPYVAGAAALVAAANPGAAGPDLAARITQSVVPSATLRTRTTSGGVLNAHDALFAVGAAAGGGPAAISRPAADRPASGARVAVPPVLAWSLPAGWRSTRIYFAGAGLRTSIPVDAGTRAASHPSVAWRSGTYRWQVAAVGPDGTLGSTPYRTYTVAPRVGAWVTSGRISKSGRTARLRIGYASSELSARVRVRITAGGRLVHAGRTTTRRSHVRGVGSPRRGWIAYDAALTQTLRPGQRIVVEVSVIAGTAKVTRRFRATVR